MKRRTKVTLAIIAAGFYCIAFAPSAFATDEPYTVTVEGVELTEGTFQANGHINWRTTLGEGSMHFDPNNGQPGGIYIGASFFPIPLAPGECILWVQIHPFNYHFGENNEAPVCQSETVPTSTLTPPVEPTPTSTPEPSSTPSQEPQPSPTPEPSPSTPQTEPTPSPSPSTPTEPSPSGHPSSSPTNSPTPTPANPSPTPTPSTGIGTPDYPTSPTPSHPATRAPTTKPTTGSGAPSTDPHTPTPDTLAVTGNDNILFGTAFAILLIGAGTLAWITREKR